MSDVNHYRTNCCFCGYLCGLIATVQADQIIAVEPDESRYPYDASIQRGCQRWKAIPEFLNHPARVNYPLKRLGKRGSDQWQKVSWNEALDDISTRLMDLKAQYGAESLATSIGGPHTVYWPLHRFMNLFGSPNNMGIGQICWNPAVWINTLIFGWPLENELDPDTTECAILWGINPAESDNSLFWRLIQEYHRSGKPLIVIDPRRTRTASLASEWLSLYPGTDAYLALGFLNVILSEQLYDHPFVEKWCQGFNRVFEHIIPYTPDYVEGKTGVEAYKVIEIARLFATRKPATLITGRGIDQIGKNTVPTHHALAILRAITGNIDVPGASHLGESPDFVPEVELELSEKLPETQRMKQLNRGFLKLQSYSGFRKVSRFTLSGCRLPERYLTSAHPNLVWRAILTGQPYPIRAMIVMGSNPLLTQADTGLVYQALKTLDLLVVLEYFRTPTAMLADYILPVAGPLEKPLFQTPAGISNIAYGGDQVIEPYYERRADFYFWKELGTRLGQEEYWPWQSYREALEAVIAPTGLSWKEFCRNGLYYKPSPYQKHERTHHSTGEKIGFSTPSGKVELYPELMIDLGYSPIPSPISLDRAREDYPLQLITGARKQPFYASSYRQIESLRRIHPNPLAEMSPLTASRLGIKDGEMIWVETDKGRAKFVVKLTEMCDDVVSIEYGWWFPELSPFDPELGGLWISNANLLTEADIETSDTLIGTWTYNGLPCRVVPVFERMELINEQ